MAPLGHVTAHYEPEEYSIPTQLGTHAEKGACGKQTVRPYWVPEGPWGFIVATLVMTKDVTVVYTQFPRISQVIPSEK